MSITQQHQPGIEDRLDIACLVELFRQKSMSGEFHNAEESLSSLKSDWAKAIGNFIVNDEGLSQDLYDKMQVIEYLAHGNS